MSEIEESDDVDKPDEVNNEGAETNEVDNELDKISQNYLMDDKSKVFNYNPDSEGKNHEKFRKSDSTEKKHDEGIESKTNWNELNNLPDEIDLGNDLNNSMNEMYKETEMYGREYGGNIAQNLNGDLDVRSESMVIGEKSKIDLEPLEKGDVGYFHTHPEGSPFSSTDISSTINSNEKLSVVHSGDNVYALTKTENTPNDVNPIVVSDEYDNLVAEKLEYGYDDYESMRLANIELADKYDMKFYEGKPNEKLDRVTI